MKTISFILPGLPYKCSGGAKVVFHYSNELVKLGYSVTIYFWATNELSEFHFPEALRKLIIQYLVYKHPDSKELDSKVCKKVIYAINNSTIQDSEFIFATWAGTAFPVFNLDNSKGQKLYLIQDYENWGDMSKDKLHDTYRLMKNIVISSWIKEIVDRYSYFPSILISNCIDSYFCVTRPIQKRNPFSICALYHEAKHKGFTYTWKVIKRLKQKYPSIEVKLFGVFKRPKWMPDWVKYYYNANRATIRKIYNNSSIMICSTINEGFGLTGAEAMVCGCALVSTDYPGIHEYAVNMKNCLLSPVKDIDSLYNNVILLLNNNHLRIKLAGSATKCMAGRTWTTAAIQLATEVFMDSFQ